MARRTQAAAARAPGPVGDLSGPLPFQLIRSAHCGQRCRRHKTLYRPLPGDGASQLGDLRGPGEADPGGHVGDLDRAGGSASVSALCPGEGGHPGPGQGLELCIQGLLIGLHGQDVVGAGLGHQRRGVVMGVQRVHRDHRPVEIEDLQQVPGRRYLVALHAHGDLTEYCARPVRERGDQVRHRGGTDACAPHGLAVDRDHPPARDQRGPRRGPGPQHYVETVRVQPREQAPQRRLVNRSPLPTQPRHGHRPGVPRPLPDRREAPCSGHDRAHCDRDQGSYRMTDPAPPARIGYPAEQVKEELVIRDGRAHRCGDAGRWHGAGVVPWSDRRRRNLHPTGPEHARAPHPPAKPHVTELPDDFAGALPPDVEALTDTRQRIVVHGSAQYLCPRRT